MTLFEWDERKSEINRCKHGITFDQATVIFEDPFVLSKQDRFEAGESRWQILGMVDGSLILTVARTVQEEDRDEQHEIIRIISARPALRKERKRYEQNRKKDSR